MSDDARPRLPCQVVHKAESFKIAFSVVAAPRLQNSGEPPVSPFTRVYMIFQGNCPLLTLGRVHLM